MMRPLILCLAFVGVINSQSVCNDSLTTYLPDSSFTASTDYTTKDSKHIYAPYRARLDTKVDTDPKAYKVGAWVALTLDKKQWLQVDLTSPSVIQAITTQGRNPDPINGCCDNWVTKYTLEYSLDGSTWTPVTDSTGADKMFDGNADGDTPVTNDLGCPIIARYIRVNPQEWHKHIALRVELNGCQIAAPTTPGPSTPSTSTQTTLVAGQLSTGQCVSDCSSKGDGYYQSCNGCDVYVKCYQKQITDNNPCPPGTVWNDNIKFCDHHSTTCQGPTTTSTPGPTTTTMQAGQLSSGQCVNDCSNKQDGYYQSCMGCEYYAKCYGKVLTDGLPCPPGTVWNDNVKFCDHTSTSCHGTQPSTPSTLSTTPSPTTPTSTIKLTPTTTTPTTTTPTTTTPTTTPTTTTPTTTTPTTTTPTTTTPTTTTPTTTTPTTTTPTTTTPTTTPTPTTTKATIPPTTQAPTTVNSGGTGGLMPQNGRCVKDCQGVPNGDYQSCRGCSVFISCSSGYSYDGKLCPGNTVWNDDYKFCDHTSPTCP